MNTCLMPVMMVEETDEEPSVADPVHVSSAISCAVPPVPEPIHIYRCWSLCWVL